MKRLIVSILMVLLLGSVALAKTAGMIRLRQGKVYVKQPGGQWKAAKIHMKLDDSWTVKLSRNSKISIRLRNGSTVVYTGKKIVKMKDIMKYTLDKRSAIDKLRRLRYKLGKRNTSGGYTPTAVVGVRGADDGEEVADSETYPISPTDLIWEE